MKTFHLPLYILLLLLASCKEKLGHDPVLRDNTRPGPVQNVRFEPINGGFDIYYDLPADKDILYVKAEYVDSKGRTATAKSSAYGNWIRIEGFGDVSEKTVTLYAVDRSENLSDPVSFKGTPLVPPLDIIKETMEITEDFSGARFTWVNELQTPIAILLYAENENGVLESVRTVYTSQRTTSFSLRGYASEPTRFAAVIRDRYDNFTDTIYPATPDRLLTPLFEEQLDKGKFRKVVLSDDTNWDAWEGYYEGWYDESLHDMDGIAHTQGDDPFPQIWTVDLGVNVKLSRFIVHQRQNQGWAFSHGNPRRYTVYGAAELPPDDGNLDNWIKLMDCESIKPSGLPLGQLTDEDLDRFQAGDEFAFEDAPEIRYFRLAVHETWDGSGFVNVNEITFWGNIAN